jgi:hypothetical protein
MAATQVRARPHFTARIAWTASGLVLAAFVVTALVMKRYNAGADFNDKDQVGTVVIGIVCALLLVMPTYPRLIADENDPTVGQGTGCAGDGRAACAVRGDTPGEVLTPRRAAAAGCRRRGARRGVRCLPALPAT